MSPFMMPSGQLYTAQFGIPVYNPSDYLVIYPSVVVWPQIFDPLLSLILCPSVICTCVIPPVIGLMYDDVLLINFTTTPHFHALFVCFFHFPCWYSFQFLSFGNTFTFWMWDLAVKLISKTSSCIRPIRFPQERSPSYMFLIVLY